MNIVRMLVYVLPIGIGKYVLARAGAQAESWSSSEVQANENNVHKGNDTKKQVVHVASAMRLPLKPVLSMMTDL